jgi:hypothetical protein
MGKFNIELRAEASEYVTDEARKTGTTKAEVVRKALNIYAALNNKDIDVILLDRKTGEKTRLMIA